MTKPLSEILADLARPWVLWSGGSSVAVATVACALAPTFEGAAVLAAAWTGLFGIYWGKANETAKIAIANAQASADVEKERAKQSPAPVEALKPAEPAPPERSLEDPA